MHLKILKLHFLATQKTRTSMSGLRPEGRLLADLIHLQPTRKDTFSVRFEIEARPNLTLTFSSRLSVHALDRLAYALATFVNSDRIQQRFNVFQRVIFHHHEVRVGAGRECANLALKSQQSRGIYRSRL